MRSFQSVPARAPCGSARRLRFDTLTVLAAALLLAGCPGGMLPVDGASESGRDGQASVDARGDLVDGGGEDVTDPGDTGADADDASTNPDTVTLSCGDGTCGTAETCASCPADCGACAPTVLDVRTAGSSDDAEEVVSSGAVNVTSTDLEMTLDAAAQVVGMRFLPSIPPGATITRAYVQFVTDEVTSVATSLVLHGQAADNAATFTTAASSISSRPRTTASVMWAPAPWPTMGEAGAAQQTADITSIVQEIVGRTGWRSGNGLVVTVSGSGKRVGAAYDGNPANAPQLHVEYRSMTVMPRCGDATCNGGETCSSCAADCGPCSGACGDGTCAASVEHCATCPGDCGACAGVAPTIGRGPYLNNGSTSAVTVRWRTTMPTDSVVAYGPTPTGLRSIVRVAGTRTEHIVRVTGLAADTRYHYAFGATGAPLRGGDANHFFVTAPMAARATRMWVLGDAGTLSAGQRAVRDAYYTFTGTRRSDILLILGDNAYPDGTDVQYQAALFDFYPNTLRNTVVWTTLGNHDGHSADSATQSGPYYDMFSLPTMGEAGGVPSGTEAYYSFDYGGIHFVCLDSYDSLRTTAGPMLTWMRNDLAAATSEWLIAFFHHPPYTKGSHDSDTESGLAQMRANAMPILESFGVDLVLTGHSHSYERSMYLHGHYGTSGTLTTAMVLDRGNGRPTGTGAYRRAAGSDDGAVYVVAGSSGQVSFGALNHPAMFVSLARLGSVIIDVDGRRLDASFLDNNGTVADSFTIEH